MKLWTPCLILLLGMTLPAQENNKTQDSEKKGAKPESPVGRLAELRLDEFVVPARMINLPLPGRTRTLQDILDQFETWSKDASIGAVLLKVGNLRLSGADIQELRRGIERLKEKGKKVLAFVNGFNPYSFLLASAADEIAIAPTGSVVIPGIGRLFPFLKGYYQMVGMEFEVIAAGRYKYPGFLNQREPNKYFQEEIDAIFDSLIEDYKSMIAEKRKLSSEAVTEAINIALFDANQALQRGLVDTLTYYDEYRERILQREKMKRYRESERGLAGVNSIQGLMELINTELRRSAEARKAVGPKIAVLHARGPIVDFSLGAGFASVIISRDDFAAVVDELRKNKSIKAVVMRVDSPGGSAYASDVIWKHLRKLNKVKPLVVSMGSVAGSGGYYISCPARRIFAQSTTITGSIGVLGIHRSARSLLNRRDVELAGIARGDRALLGAPHRNLSKQDRAFLQKHVDGFYTVFLDRVAQTRRMPAEEVHKVAEGRIWTGRDAVKIGLVDELGGLAEAIKAAREMANIPPSAELKIVHYPRPGSLGEIFESFSMLGTNRTLEMFAKGLNAARPISFGQQLAFFARNVQPLCWMAVPAFQEATRANPLRLFEPLEPPGLQNSEW